jgi:hypothetical protein
LSVGDIAAGGKEGERDCLLEIADGFITDFLERGLVRA